MQAGQEAGTSHLPSGLHSKVKVRLLVKGSCTFPVEQVYVTTLGLLLELLEFLTTGSRNPSTIGGGPQDLFC